MPMGRKNVSAEYLKDLDDDLGIIKPGRAENARPAASDSSSRLKTYSETGSLSIFRRGRQYDELLDDATSASPPRDAGMLDGHASGTTTSMSDGESESAGGAGGGRATNLGHRSSSGGLADGLLSRLNLKDKWANMPMSFSKIGGMEEPREANGAADSGKKKTPPASRTASMARKGSAGSLAKPPNTKLAAAAAKVPAPLSKKSRMQTADADFDSISFEELKDEAEAESPRERDVALQHSEGGSPFRSPFQAGGGGGGGPTPATPGRAAEHASPIARSSPSLMSSAAKLAASIQQGSRRALVRRRSGESCSLMDDSATEASTDVDQPAEEAGRSELEGEAPPVAASSSRAPRSSDVMPGAARPLLDSADGFHDGSAARRTMTSSSPLDPQNHTPSSAPLRGAHGGSPGPGGAQPRGLQTPPRPPSQKGLAWQQTELRARSAPQADMRRLQAGERPRGNGRAASSPGGEGGQEAAYDIFEPRPEATAAATPATSAGGPQQAAASRSLTEVKVMKGHDALHALQKGATLRKKWVSSTSAADAAQVPKTERLIRCRIEGSKVVLHYYHQGMKGLYDKEEVVTHVQRVEILDGPWRRGDCILLHTGKGALALEAPDAATHSTWVLGLNAALVSCQTRQRDVLLQAPAHAIPRNSMFVVTPAP